MPSTLLPVPHFEQLERGECLAACAAMVLTYLGWPVDYTKLLKVLKIQPRIGTPAYNIRELEKLGINVIYKLGTVAEIQTQLSHNSPCITFVKTSELPYWDEDTEHAVVVVGMDEQSVYLNDPAFPLAPISVPLADFDLAWFEWGEFYAVLSRHR